MSHFKGSIIFTLICFIAATFWAHFTHASIIATLFIVLVLSVLEVSLSFDNAVVNAIKLEKMSPKWQHRFLTWGIFIAVFGMRFLFPVLVVSIFAHLNILSVINMAFNDPDKYSHYLEISHPPIITFGASFLTMLFLNYFCNSEKNIHWLGFIEKKLTLLSKIKGLNIYVTLFLIFLMSRYVIASSRIETIYAGISGIIVFLLIEGLSSFLEKKSAGLNVVNGCFINFLYLELIDASFSLDGVLGAFALSSDVLVITLGLAVGAMFVRSLTLLLVEKKTLKHYIFLEHGAHWAIGVLAMIMFLSSFMEISEVITGLSGLVIIILSFLSSVKMMNEK